MPVIHDIGTMALPGFKDRDHGGGLQKAWQSRAGADERRMKGAGRRDGNVFMDALPSRRCDASSRTEPRQNDEAWLRRPYSAPQKTLVLQEAGRHVNGPYVDLASARPNPMQRNLLSESGQLNAGPQEGGDRSRHNRTHRPSIRNPAPKSLARGRWHTSLRARSVSSH